MPFVIFVSIPLRGRCNVNVDESTKQPAEAFPSPCGEDVMSTLLEGEITAPYRAVSIPLRGRCNVNSRSSVKRRSLPQVSIPLRGRCNVNKGTKSKMMQWLLVSIPLRGRCNVNWESNDNTLEDSWEFPSPCGEDVMSTLASETLTKRGFQSLFPKVIFNCQ